VLIWGGAGGWRTVINQRGWDGKGFKNLHFFGTFSRITKSWRKAYFYEVINWVH
jgi:hypothetical protein